MRDVFRKTLAGAVAALLVASVASATPAFAQSQWHPGAGGGHGPVGGHGGAPGWHGGGAGWHGGGGYWRGGRWYGGGWGPAAVGLGVLGLAAGAAAGGYYGGGYGYPNCTGYQPVYDQYGNVVGQQPVNVC
jgi:hypothetical protein